MNQVPKFDVFQINPSKFRNVLIIPVVNEGERIRKQLIEIFEANLEVDVVLADGGSTDGSLNDFSFLSEFGVTTLLVKTGPGKLSAQLRMAFHFCLNEGYEKFVTMDGNGKDEVTGVKSILEALNLGFDFVQGSRYVEHGMGVNTPRYRDLAIRFVHAPITSLAAGKRFTDTTNGFRGFSRNLLENTSMSIFRDVFSSYELIFYIPIRASRMGLLTTEVPVIREYPTNGEVPTKIFGLSAYLALMKMLIKAAFGRYNPGS